MFRWFRRRHVSYLLAAAIFLSACLSAGKIVLGGNWIGERFVRNAPAVAHLLKNGSGEKSKLEDNQGGSSVLLPAEEKPEGPRESGDGCTSLFEDGNAPAFSPENEPDPGHLEAESKDTTDFGLPGKKASPQGEPSSSLPPKTESAPAAGKLLQESALAVPAPEPASPEPVGLSVNALAGPTAQATAPLSYSLGQPHHRRFRIRLGIKNSGGAESQNIRLQIPILGRLNSPYQVVKSETFSLKPAEISGGDYNSRSAHFLIPELPPGETVSVNITYELLIYPIAANFSAYGGGNAFSPETIFLQPSAGIESGHSEIISRAEQITSGVGGDLEKARAIYQFVRQHMRYDPSAACRNQGALTALRERVGVCEDYAALFAALCRAVNIPARQVNGYADPKGTGECWDRLNQAFPLKGYRHSWAEFYLKGIGWLPVDPTMNIAARDLKYFGCLPYSSHIAQNYFDQSVRIKFQGGRLEAVWEEELI